MNGVGKRVRVKPWLGGYLAEFKLIWRSEWIRVQHWHNGKKIDQIFPTSDAAKVAAYEARDHIEEPHIVGWASKLQSAKAQAEALFKREQVQ